MRRQPGLGLGIFSRLRIEIGSFCFPLLYRSDGPITFDDVASHRRITQDAQRRRGRGPMVCWHTNGKKKMKRTTVKVPDALDARMRHEAERRGIPVSEVTREALESYLGRRRRLSFASSGRSGRRDVATQIEKILRREWGGRRTR